MQDEFGQIEEPYSLSAGLDYPGIGPMHAHLITNKRATVFAATDDEAMQAVYELSKVEGIIPALETAHALAIIPRIGAKPDDNVVIRFSRTLRPAWRKRQNLGSESRHHVVRFWR